MNTTVNINLNGMAFIINEDAYKKLQSYISELEKAYADDKEVVRDIESRLAELFGEYLAKLNIQVVSIDEVDRAIQQIGKPSQMNDETTVSEKKVSKKLYRDTIKGFIGGVSSGLAEYMSMDVSLVRVLWIILFLVANGVAAIAYLIFWIVVPDAITPTQRLEMKGKPITTENVQAESTEIIGGNKPSGCLSTCAKILVVMLAAIPIVGFTIIILFLLGVFGFTGLLMAAPLASGFASIILIVSLCLVFICPIVALIYLGVNLKNRDEIDSSSKKRQIIVYSIIAALWIASLCCLFYNHHTISDNIEDWYEGRYDGGYDSDEVAPVSYLIVLKTNYCGNFAPAVSGTANLWGITPMKKISDTEWQAEIGTDEYNQIKFQDTKGNWSNEIEFYDAETRSWQKMENINLSFDSIQEFDFTDTILYRWSGCF